MTMPLRLTRRTLLAAGAATGAATLAAPAIVRAAPAPVKIGLIHPVTGPLAFSGGQCRLGGTTAIDEINAAGGIKSMGGAQLEPMLGDAQGKPEIAASLVDQMANAGVAGFTGCFASALGLAATQEAAKYGLPFSIDSGIADSLTTRGLPNVFRLFPANTPFVEEAVQGLGAINGAHGSPAKTAILVHENSEFGTGTAKIVAEKLPGVGISVLDTISHPTPTRDFTNIVLRIKAAKPDLVIISNYQNEYILLARTLVQQRVPLKGIYSVAGGGFGLRFAKEAPDVAENIMDFNHWYNPRDPRGPAFRQRIERAGHVFTWEVLLGYFAVRLLADAMEHAASADKTKLVAALAASTYQPEFMPYGPTKFVNGQNQGAHGVGLQIQHGDIAVIWPEQFANAKAVYPRPGI
jgi:branched-chain amino acid transport system substrate-binding protein